MTPRAAIFYFHDIAAADRMAAVSATHRPYVITPEEFRALLLAARDSPRRAVTAGQVPGELGGGFYCLTFDDGLASDYDVAFPVLRELGLRATFFVVPTLVDTPGYVTWAQLREMVAAGMEIGSHSLTHPFVDALSATELEREFGQSKHILQDRLGLPIHSASLPRGWEPPRLRPVLRDLGYRVFCTSRVAWWHPGDVALSMPRIAVRHGMETEDFAAILNAERRALWRLQTIEAVKNAGKAMLGRQVYGRLRAPLLRLRYAQTEDA
jgi:peptidoglycan/xylan/chitin deacetylase (PgdA/CDA1 family)